MMRLRRYGMIFLFHLDGGLEKEIGKVSEIRPNILSGGDIIVTTFISAMEPDEIKEYFRQSNRSFIIFDLDQDGTGFHLAVPQFMYKLYSGIMSIDLDEMNRHMYAQMRTVENYNINDESIEDADIIEEHAFHDDEIIDFSGWSKSDKEDYLNEIIDKGPSNWTVKDKRRMQELSDLLS